MAFESGRRRGSLWEDLNRINEIITTFSFNISNKREREFENTFCSVLMSNQSKFNNTIICQMNNETTVRSVYCFGKRHRPDMSVNEDGIAIEIKYVNDSLDGLKQSIGQGYLYRLRYKFVVVVLVLSAKNKELYLKLVNKEEKDLEDILQHLAQQLNVYTFIVPAFTLYPKQKKVFSVFSLPA